MARSRIGIWFAATLAVPAVLAGIGLFLHHGGPLRGAIAAEGMRAFEVHRQWLHAAFDELGAHAQDEASPRIELQLDAARRVVGPFREGLAPAMPIGEEERRACALFASGDPAAALPCFLRARLAGALSPEGRLLEARALAKTDLSAARDLLAATTFAAADTRCGNLPFVLLARLLEAEWTDVGDPDARSAIAGELLRAAQGAAAAAIPTVADAIVAALPELADDERLAALRAAAAVAVQHAHLPLAEGAGAVAGGGVVVSKDDLVFVASPGMVRRCVEAARVSLEQSNEDLALGYGRDHGGMTLAAAPFAGEWSLRTKGLSSTTLLGFAVLACYVLAAATLLLGNLFVWRMTRREHALVRLRADFVDIVSHELRTPLAALSLKAEMLAAGDVPQARVPHYLHALHGDVLRLSDQVERILDFGRLEKGAPLQRRVVPARALLARGLRSGRPALRLVGQHVEVDAPRQLPVLDVDVDVLARALRNLLENAAKYAPPGSIVAVRAFADGQRLVVEVGDRGPGVAPAQRQTVFEPFVRGDAATSATPGSGLGLALVAAAARAHGGAVDVRERDGGGAVFTLSLPLAASSEAAS